MSVHGSKINLYLYFINECEAGADWCVYLLTELLTTQPHNLNQDSCVYVPYSGKFLREKTFTDR